MQAGISQYLIILCTKLLSNIILITVHNLIVFLNNDFFVGKGTDNIYTKLCKEGYHQSSCWCQCDIPDFITFLITSSSLSSPWHRLFWKWVLTNWILEFSYITKDTFLNLMRTFTIIYTQIRSADSWCNSTLILLFSIYHSYRPVHIWKQIIWIISKRKEKNLRSHYSWLWMILTMNAT